MFGSWTPRAAEPFIYLGVTSPQLRATRVPSASPWWGCHVGGHSLMEKREEIRHVRCARAMSRALPLMCTCCAKSRLFSTTGSHGPRVLKSAPYGPC